jgi:hypothetical protein
MVFNTGIVQYYYGTIFIPIINTYCQNNTSASDYGTCYNIQTGQAIFVQTDTTTYPVGSLPCEKNNTCIRYTTTTGFRTLSTVYSYSGKQAILQYFWLRVHTSTTTPFGGSVTSVGSPMVRPDPGINSYWFLPAQNYEQPTWPIYDPVTNFKAYLNPYTISLGSVAIIRWQGTLFAPTIILQGIENYQNNIWYAFDSKIIWAYESSPLAIIPLDFNNDYAPYRELRNAFGYAYTGIDQPGWNAQDMITALQDIFPNRAWAVYDDVQKILYLYNLTMDYVPDWLINRLTPVGVKVLQSPSDSSVAQAWLNALNARNPQTGGP